MSAETLHIAEEHGECAPKPTSFSIKWILISVAIGIGIYLLPTPDGMSDRAHKYLALLIPIVILWTVEAMPIGVTAIAAAA